jgi:tuftelin-interacting protein 11
MARKKRKFLEDDDSDSSRASDDGDPDFGDGDPDAREERALFEDPYQRMKRGGRSKDDTVYGVFGEEDEGEGAGRGRDKPQRRRDWAKAPAFVSGESVDLGEAMDMEQEQSSEDEVAEEEDVQEENGSVSGESDHSRAPSPRVREEEEDELPSMGFKSGGIGSSSMSAAKSFTRAGIGSSGPVNTTPESENMPRFGLGGMRTTTTAGIGSAARTPSNTATMASFASPSPVAPTPFPTAFGAMRAQRAFVRNDGSSSPSGRPATPLSSADRAHFSKISGSFGARMLAKMGWEAGTGLGATGEGIVTPVESKMRPQKMGIAFKGFKEKTEQSKAEARRRGEVVSDDEEDQPRKGTAGRKEEAGKARRSDAWKKPKKVKVKIEHKTYEQILAEAGEDVQMPNIGQIIDATGATVSNSPSTFYSC